MIKEGEEKEEEDEIICLDESFFINDDYQLTTFTFGSHSLQLLCLQSASSEVSFIFICFFLVADLMLLCS
ncbi:hypothetical protein LINPERHAP2_LOCUS14535 [Linum perenne]